MYEARQNKEKLSRRIDAGGKVRPRTKSGNENCVINAQRYKNTTPLQMFAVPTDLETLKENITYVQEDMRGASLKSNPDTNFQLYGSYEWANDTKWAALRKLNEWYIVKELTKQDIDIEDIHIGFGIDDMNEPDGLITTESGSYIWAGENKLVTGGFPQINENINSALSQLCTGDKASSYSGSNLIARVVIHSTSEAYQHLQNMSESAQKGMCTRWQHKVREFYNQGTNSGIWTKNPYLTLQICNEDNNIEFEYTYHLQNDDELA